MNTENNSKYTYDGNANETYYIFKDDKLILECFMGEDDVIYLTNILKDLHVGFDAEGGVRPDYNGIGRRYLLTLIESAIKAHDNAREIEKSEETIALIDNSIASLADARDNIEKIGTTVDMSIVSDHNPNEGWEEETKPSLYDEQDYNFDERFKPN